MRKTTAHDLRLYDPTDPPDLDAGYNHSMNQLEIALADLEQQIKQIPNPAGLATLCKALGLTAENAQTIGETLNHLINKTKAAGFTVKDLANAEITAEGHIYIPTTTTNNN